MRLIYEVHYLLAKNPPRTINLDPFKLEFGPSEQKAPKREPDKLDEAIIQQKTANSKAVWGMRLRGVKVRKNKAKPQKEQ